MCGAGDATTFHFKPPSVVPMSPVGPWHPEVAYSALLVPRIARTGDGLVDADVTYTAAMFGLVVGGLPV